jgi:Sec-independent protein translocase protein TatA
MGAYLDWHAFFDVPAPADTELNIIEWEHLATLGRDHYVKVVREGYLFPFGHRAALVKVTERKFDQSTKAAVNRQRMYIVVLEKEVLYARNNPNNQFIPFAFQAVQINTTQTPNIDNPLEDPIINVPSGSNGMKVMRLSGGQVQRFAGSGNTSYNFYINVNGKGFPFDMVLTDKEGVEHALRMPLVFLENKVARTGNLVQQIITKYNPNTIYNKMDLNEQDIAYAECMLDGDTSFETQSIQFGAEVYPATDEADIKFHPIIQQAEVFIKQLNEMTGVRKAAVIQLEDDANEGTVFASVKDAVVDFSNGSDKAGGFLSPNMGITALSKLQGPLGGNMNDSKALTFNPDDFFKALDSFPVAKIFGVIKIFDLLLGDMDLSGAFDGVKSAIGAAKSEIEDIKTEILYLENQAKELQQDLTSQIDALKQSIKDKTKELLDLLNGNIPKIPNFKTFVTAEAFYAEYKWQPEFKSNPIKVIEDILHVRVDDPNKALTITTTLEKPFDGSKEATFTGSARFEKFGIDLVPLLAVNFNYLEFKTGNAQKTNVKVDIDAEKPIEFKGALSFVNNLQNIIPSTGFSDDGPYIKLQPTQVTAGFTIGIPNVEVGICMISNISLGAHVTLPFTGAPLEMGFNFCKRENPFLLTISCFGGGGYFMMITTLKGLKSIEAAFEFGAAMSLNVGVASGGVSVMGGIYYKFELIEKALPSPDGEIIEEIGSSTITGYLRINGHLSILGIISLSMEFYLAFTAVFADGKVEKLEGIATVKVKVEVLFFSKTVSVTVRRELKGADADPKFIEMIDEDDWQEYCLAFAG